MICYHDTVAFSAAKACFPGLHGLRCLVRCVFHRLTNPTLLGNVKLLDSRNEILERSGSAFGSGSKLLKADFQNVPIALADHSRDTDFSHIAVNPGLPLRHKLKKACRIGHLKHRIRRGIVRHCIAFRSCPRHYNARYLRLLPSIAECPDGGVFDSLEAGGRFRALLSPLTTEYSMSGTIREGKIHDLSIACIVCCNGCYFPVHCRMHSIGRDEMKG